MSLPKLYSLDEVTAATGWKYDALWRRIRRAGIETVGSGKGMRLTLADYNRLLEFEKCLSSTRRGREKATATTSQRAVSRVGTSKSIRARQTKALLGESLKILSDGSEPSNVVPHPKS